jgi:hypothetical protein
VNLIARDPGKSEINRSNPVGTHDIVPQVHARHVCLKFILVSSCMVDLFEHDKPPSKVAFLFMDPASVLAKSEHLQDQHPGSSRMHHNSQDGN